MQLTLFDNEMDNINQSSFGKTCQGFSVPKTMPLDAFWERLPGKAVSLSHQGGGRRWGNVGCVYGPQRAIAWRILDAQYFGVAQRRRRVFVVASARDGFDPAKILFEFDGLRRDIAPSREAEQEAATDVREGFTASSFGQYREGVGTLRAAGGDLGGGSETLVAGFRKLTFESYAQDETASTMMARDYKSYTDLVAYGMPGNWIGRKPENGGNSTQFMREVAPAQTATDRHGVIAFNSRQDPVSGEVFGALDTCIPQAQAIAIQGSMIGRKPENGPQGQGYDESGVCFTQTAADRHAVATNAAVRRLTPVECERLQGFPEVTKRCKLTFYNNTIFDICFLDHLKINALADQRYHKSRNSALSVEEKESMLLAKYAWQSSNANQVELEKPALVNVHIDLERKLLLIHNQEKPLLSVKIADKKKWCPLPIQVEDFARLSVATLTALERKAPTGREGSQANTKNSTHQSSGEKFASLCGLEIGDHVKDVQKFTKKVTECMKYITSEAGQSSRNSGQILQTLLYCVTTAINSFIQEKTHLKSSYVLNIEITSGYTRIPWRNKPAEECPDGQRYKALGNSMAVPVMRWIGERIQDYLKCFDV